MMTHRLVAGATGSPSRRPCIALLLTLMLSTHACLASAELYMDASQPIPARVQDLLSRMTLEEKMNQLRMRDGGGSMANILKQFNQTGYGAVHPRAGSDPIEHIAARNAFQAAMINSSRLHLPVAFFAECLHSGAVGGTVFPMPITQASSWDPSLTERIYASIARSARAFGLDIAYAPVLNMWTDARFGRTQEGFSSNPTLTAHYATASVAGLQGAENSAHDTYLNITTQVISLAKHLAAYGASQGGLNGGPAAITNRTLLEVYLKPWRAFAKAGGRGMMASHNTVNDIPAHANRWLIHNMLREEFGFGDGIVCSDCNDIGVLTDFRVTANNTYAAGAGLSAGVDYDLECGNDPDEWSYNNIPNAIDIGATTEEDVNAAVSHVLTAKFATGLFDSPLTDPSLIKSLNSEADKSLSLESSDKSIVLVKNEKNLLPLDYTKLSNVAVIGPHAGCDHSLETAENWLGSYYQYAPGQGVNVSFLVDEVKAFSGPSVTVTCSQGAGLYSPGSQAMLDAAVTAAKAADVVILAVGDGSKSCGEWGDSNTLDLLGNQLELIGALGEVGTPIIGVLVNGRPVTFGPNNTYLNDIDALLETWRPGQLGAVSATRIIFGAVNPSGKLAHSFPRSVGAVHSGAAPWLQHIRGKWISNGRGPADADGRRYDPFVEGDDTGTPLFYFGYGLSYTSYSYSNLAVKATGNTDTPISVSVDVQNTGTVDGDEIVQVYLTDPAGVSLAVRFWKRLAGFKRVSIASGKTVSVSVDILFDDIAFYDDDMVFRVVSGEYSVSVGGCSNTDSLKASVAL